MGQLLPNVFNGIFPPMTFLFLEMVLSGSLRLVAKVHVCTYDRGGDGYVGAGFTSGPSYSDVTALTSEPLCSHNTLND